MQAGKGVLQHSHGSEDADVLKGPRHAEPGAPMDRKLGDIQAGKADYALAGRHQPRDQIEQCGLAGAVRANHGMDGAFRHRQVHLVHRGQASETAGQANGLQQAHVALTC